MRLAVAISCVRVRVLVLWASSTAICGCGAGTAGIVAAVNDDGGGGGPGNSPATASDLDVSAATSPATISFVVRDTEGDAVDVEIGTSGGLEVDPNFLTFTPTSADPSPEDGMVLNGLATALDGVTYNFEWDFEKQGVPTSFQRLEFQVVIARQNGHLGAGGITTKEFRLGNDPPQVVVVVDQDDNEFADTPLLPVDESDGIVHVVFRVTDSSGLQEGEESEDQPDTVSVAVDFAEVDNLDFPNVKPADNDFEKATSETGDLTNLLVSRSEEGTEIDFFWNTDTDLTDAEHEVVLRFTPKDVHEATGTSRITRAFRIDNNDEPIAVLLNDLLITNPDQRRGIRVPFRIIDKESDAVQVVFQWRRLDGVFPELPTEAARILAIRSDPQKRREKQIATELPFAFEGQPVPPPDFSDSSCCRLRLPELASSARGLVEGVAGRDLEILRGSTIPEPVAGGWLRNPLQGPVAVLPIGDGITALVLDLDHAPARSFWRLRELTFATGTVRNVAADRGAPRAMVFEPGDGSVLVASDDLNGHWKVQRVELREDSATVTTLVIADGSTELGDVRGVASLGTNAALITVGSSLIRLNFDDRMKPAVTLLDDLASPHGVVVDPLNTNQIYLAERDFGPAQLGRVTRLKLDSYDQIAVVQKEMVIPRPEAIALERSGSRLLVVTDADPHNQNQELLGMDIGTEEGEVFKVVSLPTPIADVATGPDGLRVLTLPRLHDLAVGGGIEQRRTIKAYDGMPGAARDGPSRQVVTVDREFNPPLNLRASTQSRRWRVFQRLGSVLGSSSPGTMGTFLWDTKDVLGGGEVVLRLIPIDDEPGLASQGELPKKILSPLRDDPSGNFTHTFTRPGRPSSCGELSSVGPRSVVAADMDGDGDLDLVSANDRSEPFSLKIFYQEEGFRNPTTQVLPKGSFDPRSLVAADMNENGNLDLVSANGRNLTILYQNEPGTFTGKIFNPMNGSNVFSVSVAVADLNGDGALDFVSASRSRAGGTLKIFSQLYQRSMELPFGDCIGDPISVAVADLNGDGHLDIVSANHRVNDVDLTVFFQERRGTCALAEGFPLFCFPSRPSLKLSRPGGNVRRPTSVSAADLDGDGNLDLVSSNLNTDDLSIFFQNEIGFDPNPISLSLPEMSNPCSVLAVDLNGDAKLDLVAANSGNMTVFFQTNPGEFTQDPSGPLANSPISRPVSVAAADLNGDANLDLVAAGSDNLTILFQTNPGAFTRDPNGSLAGFTIEGPLTVAAGDLDNDGDLDLVAGDDLPIFFQTSPGQFALDPNEGLLPPEVSFTPNSVAVADLNGDGDLDLVSTSDTTPFGLRIFCHDMGTGQFNPLACSHRTRVVLPPTMGRFFSVAAADVDGDGDLDLVAAKDGSGNEDDLSIFFNEKPGKFILNALQHEMICRPRSVAVADLNGDGELDLVSANDPNGVPCNISDNLMIFFRNPGMGSVQFKPDPNGPLTDFICGPNSVVAADLDGDGDLDLVSANNPSPFDNGVPCNISDNLMIFFQMDPGQFKPNPNGPLTDVFIDGPNSVAAADLDRDGDLDLVSANSASNNLVIFLQMGPGRFTLDPSCPLEGDDPRSVMAVDLDGDGDIDLVSANNQGNNLNVFYGGH